jgi:hypothetical protein
MFYGQCNDCGERWELGTARTCKCEDEEIQKVTLGTNEALRVTADGEFIWHPEADAMIEEGDFTSSPAMRHILRALRTALAAPVQEPVWDNLPSNKDVEEAMRMKRLNQLATPPAAQQSDIDAMIAIARADEREACAKICDDMVLYTGYDCAAAIRNRGNT